MKRVKEMKLSVSHPDRGTIIDLEDMNIKAREQSTLLLPFLYYYYSITLLTP